jgi:hypothetical protein
VLAVVIYISGICLFIMDNLINFLECLRFEVRLQDMSEKWFPLAIGGEGNVDIWCAHFL